MDRQAETEDRHQNWEQQKMREKERVREKDLVKGREQEKKEKLQLNQELNALEEKAKRLRDGKTVNNYIHIFLLQFYL